MARCVSPAHRHPVLCPLHSTPSCRGLAPTVASPPLRPEPAAWTHSGCPAAAATGWGRQTWGQGRCGVGRSLLSCEGRGGSGSVPAEGSPLLSPPWHRGGKPRRGGGRRGGQCQAGGLAFRCPLLGAGRPRSLGIPRLTAAASRQLLLPALLPAPAPGRCALAFSTEHLDWGRLLPRLED